MYETNWHIGMATLIIHAHTQHKQPHTSVGIMPSKQGAVLFVSACLYTNRPWRAISCSAGFHKAHGRTVPACIATFSAITVPLLILKKKKKNDKKKKKIYSLEACRKHAFGPTAKLQGKPAPQCSRPYPSHKSDIMPSTSELDCQ